ncbi:MAG: aldehyde dehydrogenase family protein, partial [Phycisphaerales bacterium]|nr:aldehyde dehydrogenase family protein [Phycisphaerales bacterium]
RALATATEAFRHRDGWLPGRERAAILRRLAAAMEANAEDLAMQAAREGGKPLLDSRIEVARAIDGVHNCVEAMRSEGGREIPMNFNQASSGRLAFTTREPIGVVVSLSAFNHPVNLIVHQVAPAVATGCPVIVKPAESTPLSCLRLVEMLREAGLPEAWCQAFVSSAHEHTETLISDPRVAFMSFIGSARVGWMLRSRLAPGTRCALEHGGVAPVIVGQDADLADAVPRLVKAGFYHAGQVCVSVQRVLAHRAVAAELAERLGRAAGALVVGDPCDSSTEVGPLIRPGEVDRVEAWVQEAIDGGAVCVTGGRRLDERCYAPTVLLDPPAGSRVRREEIFGPVVCVTAFDEVDEAIDIANELPYAFQASVFTRDIEFMNRCFRRLRAAAVMINEHTAFRVDWMPFAGLSVSGLGIGGIPYTMRDMQVEKMMVLRSEELGA